MTVGFCETTAPATREGLPATKLGHALCKGQGTTQGVEYREEPLLAITQFYRASTKIHHLHSSLTLRPFLIPHFIPL